MVDQKKFKRFLKLAIKMKIDNGDDNLNIHVLSLMNSVSTNIQYEKINFFFKYKGNQYYVRLDNTGWAWVDKVYVKETVSNLDESDNLDEKFENLADRFMEIIDGNAKLSEYEYVISHDMLLKLIRKNRWIDINSDNVDDMLEAVYSRVELFETEMNNIELALERECRV